MSLTDSELTTFRDKGYLLKRGLFPRDYVARLATEIDNLHDAMATHAPETVHVAWENPKPGRPKRILQLMNSEKVSPILDAISRSDEVLSVMRQLIGPDIYLFHSKLL